MDSMEKERIEQIKRQKWQKLWCDLGLKLPDQKTGRLNWQGNQHRLEIVIIPARVEIIRRESA